MKQLFHPFLNWNRWIIWIFPLSAVVLVAILVWDHMQKQGPEVVIEFANAVNIEPKKTTLKYLGVVVGDVESVDVDPEKEHVVVTARLHKSAAGLAREGSEFKVVSPSVSLAGVSGLETLIGGSYIRITPGQGAPKFRFEGQSRPIPGTGKTVSYFLTTPRADSLDIGAPVMFRGVKVGSVAGLRIRDNGRQVELEIQVEVPYVVHIRTDTTFWKAQGVTADLDLFDPKLEIGSLETIMKGGIAFASRNQEKGVANAKSTFPLHDKPPEWLEEWAASPHETGPPAVPFHLTTAFAGSLDMGDPVFFRDVTVGAVSDVRITDDGQTVLVEVRVNQPYAKFVRRNTVFWKREGVRVDFSLFKSKIEVNSLETLIKGGIAFATPDATHEVAEPRAKFILQNKTPLKLERWSPKL